MLSRAQAAAARCHEEYEPIADVLDELGIGGLRALAKEPAQRFGGVADMASALQRATAQLAGGPTLNPTDAPTEEEEPMTARVGEPATRRWASTRRQPRLVSDARGAGARAARREGEVIRVGDPLPYQPTTGPASGFGGTPRADAAADADLWPRILSFFADRLGS